ncbi:MAG TPA: TetR/AcrR family transcriptional regulator [Armatimonadota bacterium]
MAKQDNGDKRERILSAAREAFRRNSYDETRMADIAREAGVAPGTVYLYFASKEAIVWALAEKYVDQVSARVRAAMETTDLHAAIAGSVHAAFEQSQEERDLVRLFKLSNGLGECAEMVPADRALLDAMTEYLEAGMERGDIRRYPPRALATLIRGTVESVSELSLEKDPEETARNEAALIDILYNTLRPV